jgi:hypothetical protein
MVVSPHASERKPVPMARTTGVFSEYISSKRLNNSFFANQKTHGKFFKI